MPSCVSHVFIGVESRAKQLPSDFVIAGVLPGVSTYSQRADSCIGIADRLFQQILLGLGRIGKAKPSDEAPARGNGKVLKIVWTNPGSSRGCRAKSTSGKPVGSCAQFGLPWILKLNGFDGTG